MTAPTPDTRAAAEPAPVAVVPAAPSGRIRTLWNGIVAGIAVVVGLLPHVLHHIGFLAGTAVVAGAGGTALFAVLGLAASVPFLLKLYRRFGSWLAPAVALVVFAVMFALSAFVIGPAINGTDTAPVPATTPATVITPPTPATDAPTDHSSHHQ
jgi:hypothetical protein